MKTATEILSYHRIECRDARPGNHRTLCPECSPTRRKRRDPCLSIDIDAKGVRWNCWHCGHHGGEFFAAASPQRSGGAMGEKRPRPEPWYAGSHGRRLRNGVLR